MALSEIVTDCFALRRSWLSAIRQNPGIPPLLNHADILLIGLCVKIAGYKTIVCYDETVRRRLEQVFCDTGGFDGLGIHGRDGAPTQGPALALWPLTSHLAPPPLPVLLYGLDAVWRLDALHKLDRAHTVLPFSQRSPALWQCALAWYVSAEHLTACDDISIELVRILNDDWLDPLRLFEHVQVLKEKLQRDPMTGEGPSEDDTEDVAGLKRRIEQLENSGLIRQEILVAKAIQKKKLEK